MKSPRDPLGDFAYIPTEPFAMAKQGLKSFLSHGSNKGVEKSLEMDLRK